MQYEVIKKVGRWLTDNIKRTLLMVWNAPIFLTPHIIVSAFYMFMTPLLTYLYFTYEGAFGLRAVEIHFDLPPVVTIIVFQVSGWTLAQKRSSHIYALCVLPMVAYAVAVLLSINTIGDLAVLAGVYLLTAAALGLASIRLRFEYNRYAEAIEIMARQLKMVADNLDEDIQLKSERHTHNQAQKRRSETNHNQVVKRITSDMAHSD